MHYWKMKKNIMDAIFVLIQNYYYLFGLISVLRPFNTFKVISGAQLT